MDKEIHRFKCPHCGSDQPVVEAVGNEEKEKKRCGQDLRFGLKQAVVAVFDPSGVVMGNVPGVRVLWDICSSCGTEYVREYQVTEANVTAKMPPNIMGPNGLPGNSPIRRFFPGPTGSN